MSNGILVQAQMLIDSEQYEKAYEYLVNAYEKLKNDAEYLEKIAMLAKTLEKKDDEIKYLEELVAVNPNSLLGYSELMDHYSETNKYKYYLTRAKYKILNEKVTQAVDDYKKAINSTTEENEIINARFLLGKAYEHLNKTQNAIDEYYRIIEHKDDKAIYFKLADLYSELNDRFSAISILERGVKVYPDEEALNEYLAALYIKEGQYKKAFECAKNNFTKAKALLMDGENDKALELLENSKDEKNANYLALMAEYYFNNKNWEKSGEYIEKFRELAPQNPLVFQMKALICDENNDAYGYHYNMGKCYSYKKEYELALAEYLNAHRNDSTKPEAVKEIIKINEATGDKTSLMEFYEKLHRQEPDNTMALKGLGLLYIDLYEFKVALDYLKKLSDIDKNDNDVNKQIALCYEKLKDNYNAKKYYEKYIEKAPLSPDTEKLKEKIAKMSDNEQAEAVENDDGFLDKILSFFLKNNK